MLHLSDLLEFAKRITETAGEISLKYYQSDLDIITKADQSPVTIADQQTEEFLRSEIERKFPDHQILGEEMGNKETSSPYKWIIDPIDGTKSFISGIPFYSNLLGLEFEGRIILGISNFPALNEMYYASENGGAFLNGKKISVGKKTKIEECRVMTTDVKNLENVRLSIPAKKILNDSLFYRTWGDAYGHAMVASGRADIMLDPLMNPWDCAPFGIIIKEAGGYFGDWNGTETIYGENAFSSNNELKKIILDCFGK